MACALFFLTLCTCLVAGTHFAAAYAQNQAVSWDEFVRALTLLYRQPLALVSGLPFALTLLAILLTHELGHYFACRHHHIHSSYPYFIPFPTLIGTLGAFILIRSPIRTTRALFDVGASGPLVGFVVAVPALIFGILHAKFVPGLSDPAHASIVLGTPLILRFARGAVSSWRSREQPAAASGRARRVGRTVRHFTQSSCPPRNSTAATSCARSAHALIATLRSFFRLLLVCLALLHFWAGWYVWGALLLVIRFFRFIPIYNPVPLDDRPPLRRRTYAADLRALLHARAVHRIMKESWWTMVQDHDACKRAGDPLQPIVWGMDLRSALPEFPYS